MYELWDTGSLNCLGEFRTVGAALNTVRVITEGNSAAADTLTLLKIDSDGHPEAVAAGNQLLARIEEYA